jgi:hypothetical protein
MTMGKRAVTHPNNNVKPKIRELRQSWKQSRKIGRYGFYRYLKDVSDFYAELRKTKGRAKKVRNKILKWQKYSMLDRNSHPLLVIISASAQDDTRTINRWSQALRFASKWRRERKHLNLAAFFRKNGGVAGCASKYSKKTKPAL